MNNSTNQTDVFGNNFVGMQPEANGNQPLYNKQGQEMQQVLQGQYQNPVYQDPNRVQPMQGANVSTQGQMGMTGSQEVQSFNYPNQFYTQGGQNGIVYPQGGVAPVGQGYPPNVFNTPSFVETNTQGNGTPSINQNPSFVVEPEPIIERREEMVQPTDSYTEMAFAGVNRQEGELKQVTVLTSEAKPVDSVGPVEVSVAENMQPVEKKADENAGLRFLGIIFLVLIVVILCLPLIGLN